MTQSRPWNARPGDRIDELPAQAALRDQVGMDELREMERKRRRLNKRLT
jgi:hypothetical protein